MLSIRPKWCEKIARGEKTIEVRKTRPKMNTPFKCYIYCTLPKYPHEDFIATDYPRPQFYGGGKVIGEFICDAITRMNICGFWDDSGKQLDNRLKDTCLTSEEFGNYLGENVGYGWHISNLRIYDPLRDLGEFSPVCRYKNDDGSCPSRRVACSFQRYDYNHDGSINLVECGRPLEHPPQSWCYVEAM
jgi:predicted transcriptional regulator